MYQLLLFFGINSFLSIFGLGSAPSFKQHCKNKALMHARYHGFVYIIRLALHSTSFLGFEYAWCFVCTTSLYIAEPHNVPS